MVARSYRGIGSSSGKIEFLAKKNAFGCSEVPVYESDKTPGEEVLQLPMVLGAMSVFHSIPDAHVGTAGLELTPCMLAKIFSRGITRWNDPLLREGGVNQGLADVDEEIRVYHRTRGSSTTNFFTQYLHESTRQDCPGDWTASYGTTVTWAASTNAVVGSGGMSSALQAVPYGIGYIDSGHGHDDGLKEVKLQNLAGNFVDSLSVGEAGVLAAADAATLPDNAWGDWGEVNLINQAGADTWPIVAISYLLVHQDQTANGDTGSLLKAYLDATMDSKYGGQEILRKCLPRHKLM
jgi:ABC-type phosphate transport system substrate-binding protein